MSSSERQLVEDFVTGLRNMRSSDPMGVNIAADIVNVCLSQLKTQRRVLQDITMSFDEYIISQNEKLSKELEKIDGNIEYIEERLKSHPELKQSDPNLNIRKSQLRRCNAQMCTAADAYILCTNETNKRPTLEALIEKLSPEIPESMVRKNFNLTKVSRFINQHKDLF